ncbi:hypothetical protein PIB30_028386 [Stylosanthes scabra]|uniref:Haloacid dehalogenase-like hydrolase domain-containing protein n=1 Tax=Stylosanthes scabra TaxID=79078 RepID=A0ABU6TAN2_9FABA|nr:hypothetical protein [Stylosanthes scabra]
MEATVLRLTLQPQIVRVPCTFSYNNCYLPSSFSPGCSSTHPRPHHHHLTPLPASNSKPSRFARLSPLCSLASENSQEPSSDLAVLLEVDGVLMDAYRVGNRLAFNKAFEKLGLDCANWTEPIYGDLLRRSAGDEEKMIILYFNRIGWPTSLPTNEKGQFTKSVLQEKEKAIEEFVMSKELPLRPGVEHKSGDNIARTVKEKLGNDRSIKVIFVGNTEVEQSLYGQLVSGKVISSGVDEELAKEAKRAVSAEKQRLAKDVASLLKLSVEIDTTLSESIDKIVAALRAGAEYAGLPVCNCVLVAGSQYGVAGANRVGMPCVVLRSSLTSRAEFPLANATMDSFGSPDLTISRLRNICKKKQP